MQFYIFFGLSLTTAIVRTEPILKEKCSDASSSNNFHLALREYLFTHLHDMEGQYVQFLTDKDDQSQCPNPVVVCRDDEKSFCSDGTRFCFRNEENDQSDISLKAIITTHDLYRCIDTKTEFYYAFGIFSPYGDRDFDKFHIDIRYVNKDVRLQARVYMVNKLYVGIKVYYAVLFGYLEMPFPKAVIKGIVGDYKNGVFDNILI